MTDDSKQHYERLFQRHPQPMWFFDPETLRFLAVNDAAVAAYGYSHDEFLAMTIADIRPPEDRAALEEAVQDSSRRFVAAGIWRHRRKDGSLIRVRVTSNAVTCEGRNARLVLAEDVTALSRLEEQLHQTQKMEAIGNLAGGIAHDFNNILLVIRGHASLLLDELGEEPLRYSVEQIDLAAERASEFTHQLLAFSRQQILEPELLDVNTLVTEMVQMLDRTLGGTIEVNLQLEPELAPILIDRRQFSQAILNLVANARDAMPGGGALTIRTANVDLDEAYAANHEGVAPGPHVLLQVTDSGVGMDAQAQARAFEPFFTTKDTGIRFSLATVFGLVKQSNGSISVESTPEAGTTFELRFPSARGRVAAAAEKVAQPSLDGAATILLVDDSEAVRTVVTELLQGFGYTVLTAGRGEEAFELAERHRGAIDLLMTDIGMPGMSGPALADKVLALDPDVRVLFTSGLAADMTFQNEIIEARHGFIEKPYLAAELARKLQELLG